MYFCPNNFFFLKEQQQHCVSRTQPTQLIDSRSLVPPSLCNIPQAQNVKRPAPAAAAPAAKAAAPAAKAAAKDGTQAPPPAKLELPKAKIEAKAVNEKQWINPIPAAKAAAPAAKTAAPAAKAAAKAAAPAPAASKGVSALVACLLTVRRPRVPFSHERMLSRHPIRSLPSACERSHTYLFHTHSPLLRLLLASAHISSSVANKNHAPFQKKQTQAPPPAKLELPKAKLEAKAVNEKQWINPAPAAATPAAAAPAKAIHGPFSASVGCGAYILAH